MPVSGALVMSTSPSVDYGEIRQRLMQTSDYIKITENDAGYPKGNLEDIKPLLIKIKLKGSYLGADDFFLLSKGNRILSQWQQFLSKNKESYTWLAQLAGDFEVDQALSDKIDEVIDDRGEVLVDHLGDSLGDGGSASGDSLSESTQGPRPAGQRARHPRSSRRGPRHRFLKTGNCAVVPAAKELRGALPAGAVYAADHATIPGQEPAWSPQRRASKHV